MIRQNILLSILIFTNVSCIFAGNNSDSESVASSSIYFEANSEHEVESIFVITAGKNKFCLDINQNCNGNMTQEQYHGILAEALKKYIEKNPNDTSDPLVILYLERNNSLFPFNLKRRSSKKNDAVALSNAQKQSEEKQAELIKKVAHLKQKKTNIDQELENLKNTNSDYQQRIASYEQELMLIEDYRVAQNIKSQNLQETSQSLQNTIAQQQATIGKYKTQDQNKDEEIKNLKQRLAWRKKPVGPFLLGLFSMVLLFYANKWVKQTQPYDKFVIFLTTLVNRCRF